MYLIQQLILILYCKPSGWDLLLYSYHSFWHVCSSINTVCVFIYYKQIVQSIVGRVFWVIRICDEVYRFGLQFLLFEKVITILRNAKKKKKSLISTLKVTIYNEFFFSLPKISFDILCTYG